MNKLLTAEQLAPQRQTTTVFTSGNSQALGSANMKIELLGTIPLTPGNIAHA